MKLPLRTLHIYVACSLLVFAIVQSLKIYSIAAPQWVFSFVNDFLVIPIIATICLHGVWLLKNNKAIRLNGFTIASLVLLYSIYLDRKSTRLNSSHVAISYAVFCLTKKI